MALKVFFRDWGRFVHRYGLAALVVYPFDLVRVRRGETAEGFDARFGTDTSSTAFPWDLPSVGGAAGAEIHIYEATPAWLIREILGSLPLRLNAFTFVDMGSGKGRTLLVASEFPFARLIGVELSRELHLIALANIGQFRAATGNSAGFSLLCMNAVDYEFEHSPLVVFMFNPFGRETTSRVFANLGASLSAIPRDIYVVYINAKFKSLSRKSLRLDMIRKGGSWWRPWGRYEIYAAYPLPE